MQKFSDAAKFREKGLPHEHELYICFADVAAIGEYAWTPAFGVLPSFMQSNEDKEQPCEDIADSSPVYTTSDADVTGGGGAGGVGGGDGVPLAVGGGVGFGGGYRGDSSKRWASDGGSMIRNKKKNELGGAARLHRALDEITVVLRSQGTASEPPS